MNKITKLLLLLVSIPISNGLCQSAKGARYFGEPILTDSTSTLFIPTRYNEHFFTSNKITLSGDYFANFVVYNFLTDSSQKLFDKDTFIQSFNDYYAMRMEKRPRNITDRWIFLLVKTKDTNNSGRIDERDPSVLFAASTDGLTLKQLTSEKECVVSFDNFEKQGFLLLKIQKDFNGDGSFKNEDKEFYFKRVNLQDLTLGKEIKIN